MAVKCLKAWNDSGFQQMQMEFIKEANAMSLLDHPHIIRLYGVVLSVPMMLVSTLFTDKSCKCIELVQYPQWQFSGFSCHCWHSALYNVV